MSTTDSNQESQSLSPLPKIQRFNKLSTKYLEVSSSIYSKMVPYSLKHIEFISKHNDQQRHITRTPKAKDEIVCKLHKNHIKSQNSCNIVILPKSPFGKHKSYNDEENFSENHFVFNETSESPKLATINKKIGLLNKRIKKKSLNSNLTRKKTDDLIEAYQSQGGKLFCLKPKPLIEIYQGECERYKAFNLQLKGDEMRNQAKRQETPGYFFKGVFERLSVKDKTKVESFKKWEGLFDSKILNLN